MRTLALASSLALLALCVLPPAAAHHVPYPGNALSVAVETYKAVNETQPMPDLVDGAFRKWARCLHYHLDCIPIVHHDCAAVLAEITYNTIGWLWYCASPD